MGDVDSMSEERGREESVLSIPAPYLIVTFLQVQHMANYLKCAVATLWVLEILHTPLFCCLSLTVSLFSVIPLVLSTLVNILGFILSSKHSEMLLYFLEGAQIAL